MTDHAAIALRWQQEMLGLLGRAADARDRRDAAIAAMHTDDGLTPAQIHRALGGVAGLSLSNVHSILRCTVRRRVT